MVGHVSPEAADGGPLALVEDGDMVVVDVQVGREGGEGREEEGVGGGKCMVFLVLSVYENLCLFLHN
jgi:hypothetical protein